MMELRKHARLPLRLIVDYEDADDFISDYTDNLSAGGTFIHTTRVLDSDTPVQLVLSFPGLLKPISLSGVVRWSRGGAQPGVGLEFLPGGDRDELDALVARIQSNDPSAVGRVVRILVAEDNVHVCDLICTGLGASAKRAFGESLAFYFATAPDGASALELLKTNAFDLAIIEAYLPVLDGVRLIVQARSTLGLVDLPIIAIAANEDAARRSTMAAGANLFLAKPMRLRDVLESMRQLILLS